MENFRERCYQYSVNVTKFVSNMDRDRVGGVLGNQLLRSATSIGANIVEGAAASSKKDLIKFYVIALKSANETGYWLRLIGDTTKVDSNQISYLVKENREISKILGASILTMKG